MCVILHQFSHLTRDGYSQNSQSLARLWKEDNSLGKYLEEAKTGHRIDQFRPERILPFWARPISTDIVEQHVVSEGNRTFWHPSTSTLTQGEKFARSKHQLKSHFKLPQLMSLYIICSCSDLLNLPGGIRGWKASFWEETLCQVASQRADWGHENCAAARILGSEQGAGWKVQVRKSAKMHHSIPRAGTRIKNEEHEWCCKVLL